MSKSGAPLAVLLAHGMVGHAAGSNSKGLIKQQHGEGMPVCQHDLVVLDPVGDLHQEASRAQAGTQLPHCTSWPQQQLPQGSLPNLLTDQQRAGMLKFCDDSPAASGYVHHVASPPQHGQSQHMRADIRLQEL